MKPAPKSARGAERDVPPGTPPKGYRFLRRGELIQPGDQFMFGGALSDVWNDVGFKVGYFPSDFDGKPWVRPLAPRATPAKAAKRKLTATEAFNREWAKRYFKVNFHGRHKEVRSEWFLKGYRAAKREGRAT